MLPLLTSSPPRSDRAAKKRALVDFNADDNQEGVMDRFYSLTSYLRKVVGLYRQILIIFFPAS